MFEISIENLKLEAIMGILEVERIKKQQIVVNMKIRYKYENRFLDYKEIAEFVENKIISKKYFLIEDALLDISQSLKEKFPSIFSVEVKINKPNILSNCDVGVKIQKNY